MINISANISQLHASYSALGKDFKNTFDELVKHLNSQQEEAEALHRHLSDAGAALASADEISSARLSAVLSEEKARAEDEQVALISQITSLIQTQSVAREKRLEARVASLQSEITTSRETYRQEQVTYDNSMIVWSAKQASLVDDLLKSRESVKSKIKKDWTVSHVIRYLLLI